MKKVVTTDALKIGKFIDKTALDSINEDTINSLLNYVNNRYDNIDLLNYLVNLITNRFNNGVNINDNKLEKYFLLIKGLLIILNQEKYVLVIDFDIEKFDFLDLYKEYCEELEKEELEVVLNIIKDIMEQVNINKQIDYAKMKDYDIERIEKLTKTVRELSSKIGEYERLLRISSNQNKKDENSLNKTNKKINEQKRQLNEVRKELKLANGRADNIELQLNKSNKENEKLRIALLEKENENEKLVDENNCYLSVLEDAHEQNLKLKEENSRLALIPEELNEKQLLDEYILNLLFDNKYSLNALFDEVVKVHPNLSIEELKESLRRISTKVSINPVGTVELKKEYQVCPPYYKKYQKLLLNTDKKYKDVLFISDLHISETPSSCDYDINRHNSYFTKTLNDVYDYCAKNNIDIICNLGDLLDIRDFSLYSSKENYDRCLKVIEEANKFLPYDVNISHAIMGGNHDADLFAYGIDPITMLANSREDIIDLGYDDAFLKFKNSDFIGLHHKGIPKEEKMGNAIEFGKTIANNLNFKYSQTTFNRDNSYLDLFGHFHKSRLDTQNKYGVVPSLTTDRNLDGAWHLRFFFDDNGLIDYIIIYQLNFNQGLKVSMEIPYQRIRKQTTN